MKLGFLKQLNIFASKFDIGKFVFLDAIKNNLLT